MTADLIDTAALAKLKEMIGGETEDLAELVDDFVAGFADQVVEMRRQAVAEDWGALRISSHSTKSNARDMGAVALSTLCADLELQCKSGAPEGAAAQVAAIETAGQAAIIALKGLDLAHV